MNDPGVNGAATARDRTRHRALHRPQFSANALPACLYAGLLLIAACSPQREPEPGPEPYPTAASRTMGSVIHTPATPPSSDSLEPLTSVSGRIDSALIDSAENVRVVLARTDASTADGENPPRSAAVEEEPGTCQFRYRFDDVPAGSYTLTLARDDTKVIRHLPVRLDAGAVLTQDFLPERLLRVGPGRPYASPQAAAAAAGDGDVIEFDAGSYVDAPVSWTQHRLTLRGVGGRAQFRPLDGAARAVWTASGDGVRIENVDISGGRQPAGDGSGLHASGRDVRICRSYFHDNDRAIVANSGTVVIEHSEFAANGAHDGSALVIGAADRLVVRHNDFRDARGAAQLRSAARDSLVRYNRILDSGSARTAPALEFAGTGRAFVIGNLIRLGALAKAEAIVAYGTRGGAGGAGLYVVNNNFLVDAAGGSAVAVHVPAPVRLVNNLIGRGLSPLLGAGSLENNMLVDQSAFLAPQTQDYRLRPGSPAIDAGVEPGVVDGIALRPGGQALHPMDGERRPENGRLDVGAYEAGPLDTLTPPPMLNQLAAQ